MSRTLLILLGSILMVLSACSTGPDDDDDNNDNDDSGVDDDDTGPDDDDDTGPDDDDDTGGSGAERLYFATGEYNAAPDWHAVLRFEGADGLDTSSSGPLPADGTMNVQGLEWDPGLTLNFAHDIHVDESRDAIWLASIFTTADGHDCEGPQDDCGSIAVVSGASSLSSGMAVERHIFGDNTGLSQPHGFWVDSQADRLYVANTMGQDIRIWDNASSVDGNEAPDRIVTSSGMGSPVDVFLDAGADRLFVACMPMGEPGAEPQILIYDNASTIDGHISWDYRIAGGATRLTEGNNQTTHNVWFEPAGEMMIVGHHTNEVLFYSLNGIWATPGDHDIAPRVLSIADDPGGADQYDWSAYGFFYVSGTDRLYVAAGYTPGGTSLSSGGPDPGSPSQAIKVYDGVSEPSFEGTLVPDRVIHWDSGDQFVPPQPIWVSTN